MASLNAVETESRATTMKAIRANHFGGPDGKELRQIGKLIDQGIVKPVISTVLPIKDAAKAHELSQSGHVRGKIVLKVSD